MNGKLVGRQEVNLNLTNAKGETPLDTAEYMILPPVSSGCKVLNILVLFHLLYRIC